MPKVKFLPLLLLLAVAIDAFSLLRAEPWLGDAPKAPAQVPVTSGARPHLQSVTGGFSVDASSREQVRSFYNAVYTASDGVVMGSTADIASCTPGTNAVAFQEAGLRRINWFRALAGLPAAVAFDSGENVQAQAAALMMAANTNLQHTGIPPTWHCFSTAGTNAAANANLALGYAGADAITGYLWDFGANNAAVGHRRWILYPQTQTMGSGDVPAQNNFMAANATWIIDANYGGPRPVTRTPYVQWPPAGFVPYQVVFPQWSFALSNADFSSASVNVKSNGVNVAVTQQTYAPGYGENTLVWYLSSLDPSSGNTVFPFNGTDTVYTVTVSNVITSQGTKNFTNTVTVFDPAVPGAGFSPPVISGTNQPAINVSNAYVCTPVPDPNVTGYQWLTAQSTNGNFFDGAESGLGNFTVAITASYSAITNLAGETGSHCFYLAMPAPADQLLQLNRIFFPATNTTVSFSSRLGYATTNQIAKLQVSTNTGTAWKDVYSQIGSNGAGEAGFTTRSFSLSNYVGTPILLRFNYHFSTSGGGNIYNQVLTNPPAGWFLDSLVVTNTSQWINLTTNATSSTNFNFVPTLATNYNLLARALIFNQFPLDWGPVKTVTAVVGPPVMVLAAPVLTASQVQLNFTLAAGVATTFRLLQTDKLGQPWITNTSALLTTNIPGSSYRFTTTNGPATRFYRIQTP